MSPREAGSPSVTAVKRGADLCLLREQIGEAQHLAAVRCAERFRNLMFGTDLEAVRALIAYGGGKDSSYMLAFVRLAQLVLWQQLGATFKLRVVTNRHAGMVRAVMRNIDRVYKALSLYDDADVELLLVDGADVKQFAVDLPFPAELGRKNRLDVLMAGHRCQAEARPTFCNACNFSMVGSFVTGLAYGERANLIITGDSLAEQRAYLGWVKQISKKMGLPRPNLRDGFKGILQAMGHIGERYSQYIHGLPAPTADASRRIGNGGSPAPLFFSIYQDTDYQVAGHWEFLTGYLGFEFDEIAFSFTESDCGNPALMAHLRGLRAERLYKRSYLEGIAEYVEFAVALMRRKSFPEPLIEVMRRRYDGQDAVHRMRCLMTAYAKEAFDLREDQLVCMVYSPFTQRGHHLARYLAEERPAFVTREQEIRTLLRSDADLDEGLARELTCWSGLGIQQLRVLYRSDLTAINHMAASPTAAQTPIALVLAKDPHKAVIETQHSPFGPPVQEWITGR
jgi:hypothetical protein